MCLLAGVGVRFSRVWDSEAPALSVDEFFRGYGSCVEWPLFSPCQFIATDDCFS